MSDPANEELDDDGLGLDEAATGRARGELARLFAEHKIPGALRGDLFCFDFADLVARIEILRTADPARVHAHMTVSAPSLAVPVLDCWVAGGADGAEAVASAIVQWAQGPYWAYHDALAHDHAPTYVVEREACTFHVFEAALQRYGEADPETLLQLGVTRSLVERVALGPGAAVRGHRLRWVYGHGGIGEVFLDDEARPDLAGALGEVAWPAGVIIVRHSAVLLPAGMSRQRQAANPALGQAQELLAKAAGLVDLDTAHLVRGALQHGIERESGDERLPDLCRRWAELLVGMVPESQGLRPADVPLSRGLLEAYASMLAGRVDQADAWLAASLGRGGGVEAQAPAHRHALAQLYGEAALPVRADAVINGARQAQETGQRPVSFAVSALEAPSAIASVRHLWPEVELSVAEIGDPDPRRPRSASALSLWTYRSKRLWDRARGVLAVEARPAIAPPSARAEAAVARVAETPFSASSWRTKCRQLAAEVPDLDQLLAAMVHPPTGPAAVTALAPWDWRFQVMVAAALAIGHLDTSSAVGDHPLVRLLDGPVDWSTTAAVIALGDLALRRPELTGAVRAALEARLAHPTVPVWYQCFVTPARWVLLRLSSPP
jgi:hypothetical protein